MKDLILVESPTKAKTLNNFLKGKFNIQASMGHIRDLPKSKLGVDVDNDFSPTYVIPKDKRKVLESLKDKVGRAERVLLATDPDREGEAISYHLYEILKPEADNKASFKRIVFHEITEDAINEAIENPRDIDMRLVDAQTARRVLDRIVGYKLSPLLWKKVKSNLSAGRVQSVALRLIVEREREIEKFKSEEYCRVFVVLSKANGNSSEFELVEIDGEKVEITNFLSLYDGEYKFSKTILDQKKADEILKNLQNKDYKVFDVITKESRRSPYPPFITSTIQIEAARRLGFPSRKTMSVAQKLYEEGFITYHRTDSFNLSHQFINKARGFIKDAFGEKYLSKTPRVFKTKSKTAQEAHEAIRPTSLDESSKLKAQNSKLGSDYVRLYELIYKRTLATQMADAIFESTTVIVDSEKYRFKANGSVLLFDGFLKVWYFEESDNILPVFEKEDVLKFIDSKVTSHTTNPPPRYNEASLIGSLEKNGIGRPSTYATIVSTIIDRHYVERVDNRFQPTPIGISVNDFLVKYFSDIDDIPFTAEMEDDLDEIANGELEWVPMIKNFYEPFNKKLESTEEKGERMKIELEKTDKKCPECGNDVVIRYGRYGKFYSCSKFPECKYTAPYIVETQYVCPECLPAGRQGGVVIARRTRRGRTFFGCSSYPKCKFAVWKLADLKKKT